MEFQTTIEKLPELIRKLNLPPQTRIRLIIDDRNLVSYSPKPGKGRWAKLAERISKESPLDEKAGEALRKASKEFRNNFQFRLPPGLDE